MMRHRWSVKDYGYTCPHRPGPLALEVEVIDGEERCIHCVTEDQWRALPPTHPIRRHHEAVQRVTRQRWTLEKLSRP